MLVNSKERVRNALLRRPTDRVPVWMWFHPQTVRFLSDLLEIPRAYVGTAMGDDVRQTWVNNNYMYDEAGISREEIFDRSAGIRRHLAARS